MDRIVYTIIIFECRARERSVSGNGTELDKYLLEWSGAYLYCVLVYSSM